jgi:hypothetical protein
MADHNEQKKDFSKVDPDNLDLSIKGEPAGLPGPAEETPHFSGKPPADSQSAKLPEVEPDTMPGDTEVDRVRYQRY